MSRALAPKPSLLLLDKPFSNLDTHLLCKIREDLKEIVEETGITSIFVTHDKEDAKCIADRVVLLNQGITVAVGEPRTVLS